MASVPAVEYRRRAQDAGEPSNAQLLVQITETKEEVGRLRDEFDAWIKEHRSDHQRLDDRWSEHTKEASIREYRIGEMSPDVKAAHDVKVRLDTIVGEVRLVGVGVILSIAGTFAHVMGIIK